jgi:hypothetical protein
LPVKCHTAVAEHEAKIVELRASKEAGLSSSGAETSMRAKKMIQRRQAGEARWRNAPGILQLDRELRELAPSSSQRAQSVVVAKKKQLRELKEHTKLQAELREIDRAEVGALTHRADDAFWPVAAHGMGTRIRMVLCRRDLYYDAGFLTADLGCPLLQ